MFECLWFELWEVKFMLLIVDIIVLFVLVVSKLAFGGISTWVFILFSEYPTLRLLPLPPILRYLFFPLPPPPFTQSTKEYSFSWN